MNIIFILVAIFAIPALFWVLKYNMHMFQLNGYKNVEHINWMKKNYRKQALLFFLGVAGIIALWKSNVVTAILTGIVWLIIWWYYHSVEKNSSKKKIAYTKRMKRLIFTAVLADCLGMLGFVAGLGIEKLIGAAAIVVCVQPLIVVLVNIINGPVEKGINNYYINDAKKMLAKVPGIKVIGVTGSYGKTSVKYYLHTLLRERFHVLITPESYNTPMGVVKTIRESLKSTHEIFVCEMGARHVGDIKEICDIVHPDHGIITSIGPQHLETFFSMDNIVKTKFELADALPEGGMLFLNGDNTYIKEQGKNYPNKISYCVYSEEGEYRVENIQLSQVGTEFTVTAPNGEKEVFQLRLIGEHNIINVLGAIAIANYLGISLKDLKVPVRRIQPVEHRMQMIPRGNVTIIDDAYNSNPIGSKAAVETLAMFEGVRILITPGMVELGKEEEEYNYKFGTYAAKCCDYILLVGKRHTKPIEKAVLDSGFAREKCIVFNKLEEALEYAYGVKEEGHKYILLENDLPDNY